MSGTRSATRSALLIGCIVSHAGLAHVPYIEASDLTAGAPFVITDVEQSKAVYAWLDRADDVDFYLIRLPEPARIYARTIIPYCLEYAEFRPSFALIGPGLPAADGPLPVEPEARDGAVVRHDEPGNEVSRPSMYEYFSDQFYFEGPTLNINDAPAGDYWLIVWSPNGEVGDYVAIVGRAERFSAADMELSMRNTRIVRARSNLHIDCTFDF